MTSLDDLPLDTGQGDSAQMAPSAPSSPGPRVVVLVVLVAAAIAVGAWFYLSRPRATAAAPPGAGTAPASAQAVAERAVAPALPPLEQMDPYAREVLSALGTSPLLLKWLATDDLMSSIATAIDRLAQGQSPARDLVVLRPTTGFAVARVSGVSLVAPASYARYGPLVDAVAAVDPVKLAAAFNVLRPRLAEAYTRHGHPEGGFDEAVRKAIAVVAATPDVPDDAALVPGIGGYAYANPSFEGLPPAQKHLIRMGPDPVRRVRDAARRFGEALAAASTAR